MEIDLSLLVKTFGHVITIIYIFYINTFLIRN